MTETWPLKAASSSGVQPQEQPNRTIGRSKSLPGLKNIVSLRCFEAVELVETYSLPMVFY